jgi:hypothetical protein
MHVPAAKARQHHGVTMARFKIAKRDGTPTPYFWSDKDGSQAGEKTVYKKTTDGVKRMRGVRYDTKNLKMNKD